MIDRPLSTLEMTVLGILLKQGPCVAHAVIVQLAESNTDAYRSGAGAVYPLLSRLAEAGYVQAENRKYSLSEAGLQALRHWVCPPIDPAAFSTNLDVLRSRSYFLKLLSPSEIVEFTESARAGLLELLAKCHANLAAQKASGDRFGELAVLGAVMETEARLSWIEEIRNAFT